jgi:predicted RNA-binding Zn-ribbon protein involved in translation (DUF1610 family)
MSKSIELTQEEKKFCEAIQDLLNSESPSKSIVTFMIDKAADAFESGGLLLNSHNLQFLTNFCNSPDVKVMAHFRKSPAFCPKCGKRMRGWCGKLQCYECNIHLFVETEDTKRQCPNCLAYRDRVDPRHQITAFQGFGEGCEGVFGKGDEVTKLKEQIIAEKRESELMPDLPDKGHPLDVLSSLSPRYKYILQEEGITKVEHLLNLSITDIENIPNIGKTGAPIIADAVRRFKRQNQD